MKKRKLVIFGTGEIAELAKFYFEHDSDYEVAAFTADDEFVGTETFLNLPLVPFSKVVEKYPPGSFEMHVALSYRKINRIREEKYKLAKTAGYTLASYVSTKSAFWPDLTHGDNCLILENQTIQPTVKIGSNVMIWSGNHIGHGTHIGDHTYISSHVCISGHTKIGQRCFFGVNATTRDFVKIGDEVFVTMGALVTGDVQSGAVLLAANGTTFEADTRQGISIKKKYFGLD